MIRKKHNTNDKIHKQISTLRGAIIFFIPLTICTATCKVLDSKTNTSIKYEVHNSEGMLINEYSVISNKIETDSVYIKCFLELIRKKRKKRPLKLDYQFQTNSRCHDFINLDSVSYNMTKVAHQSFNVEGEKIWLLKYYYDEGASWDEEEVIILNVDLGILFIHTYWGSTYELIEHPHLGNVKLNKLKELVKEDKSFYKNWDSCIWN